MSGAGPAKPFASWWARDVIRAKSCTLSGPARSLLMLLAAYANAANYCHPGRQELADALAVNPSTIKRARAELEAAGLVKVFAGGQGPRATNGYWLPVTGSPPQAPKRRTLRPLNRPQGAHRAPLNGAELSTRGAEDAIKGRTLRPEVDIEVSRKRARDDSPPLRTKSGRQLLRPGYEDWGAP